MKESEQLLGLTLERLNEITNSRGLPDYAAKQLAFWLYKKQVGSIKEMTNLPVDFRNFLEENYEIGATPNAGFQISADGTKKYLFKVDNEKFIESVYIPEAKRKTLCISSQAGCRMACVFCMTGKLPYGINLSQAAILNQILSLPEKDELTNYVFMGMGEPFANTNNLMDVLEIMTSDYGFALSPSRITVSTIGLLPGIKRFVNSSRCHLAISLHSPFKDERTGLVPAERAYPIEGVIKYLKNNPFDRQRRLSFEYIMFKGINDSLRHVNGLSSMLNGLKCRLNLIAFHPVPGVKMESSDELTMKQFSEKLNSKGIITTIRTSRGIDISAACGMLSANYT